MTILACLGLSVVACSCAAHRQPPCVSSCGMLLEDKGNGSMSCDALDEAEKTMLDQIDKEFCRKDKRMCKTYSCGQLFGWQLKTDSDVIMYKDYKDAGMLPVVGLSTCATKEMWLGANQDWRHGSYPHEVFHAIQDCYTGWRDHGETVEHGGGHEGWKDHGIYDFIDDFRTGRR